MSDKQLSTVDKAAAKMRWQENLPCTLKQMAVALDVGYDEVRRGWAKEAGFPIIGRCVFRQQFEAWLTRRSRLAMRKAEAAHADLPRQGVDKSGEPSCSHGLPSALPAPAARVLARAGL